MFDHQAEDLQTLQDNQLQKSHLRLIDRDQQSTMAELGHMQSSTRAR